MRLTLLLALALMTIPALAQASPRSSVSVPCSVRILPAAAADYNSASEFTLRGTVSEAQDGVLKLRLPVGQVRVQVGNAFPSGTVVVGQTVEVLASKLQDDQGQRFIAREVRHSGGTLVLRDARGVPVQP